ncbi:hypothetical protein PGTUg99_025338 [Puccinia graminis f. sp. tritici]|uniref:Uncharacterized protein n=1 Tax=Puccinia graminis f. sp. tritici TaxID=56615 RepID=A0A5B0RF23_PUCGR|nr:hypothetical protein PGTUg99_025338 [Puccinia graminis f. sp. tritici]
MPPEQRSPSMQLQPGTESDQQSDGSRDWNSIFWMNDTLSKLISPTDSPPNTTAHCHIGSYLSRPNWTHFITILPANQ